MDSRKIALKILEQDAVFSSLPACEIEKLTGVDGFYAKYGQNETVYSSESFRHAIGIILSGVTSVYRSGNGNRALINRLRVGDKFGVASLYCPDESYVTDIIAEKESVILFIPADLCDTLIRKYPDFAVSYIAFLSGRIRFLNKRISEFSATGVEGKLAKYLLNSERQDISPNMVCLASSLGIGRASLYRIVDSFTEKGLIVRDGKKIIVMDREKLKELE